MRARIRVTLLAACAVLLLGLLTSSTAVAAGKCTASLTSAEKTRLAKLSDVSRGVDLYSARSRVNSISEILVSKRDYRGLFAIFYRDILADAIPSIERGDYANRVWTTKISVDFVTRYLDNFNRHITGRTPTGPWKNFYSRAAACKQSAGRIVMSALTAHLVVDFPESVLVAGSTNANKADFFKVGDQLVLTTPRIVADIKNAYGYDLAPFFRLWFASDLADPILGGPGRTTYYFFQGIRGLAWVNGLALRSTPALLRPITRTKILAEWAGFETALDALAATGKL